MSFYSTHMMMHYAFTSTCFNDQETWQAWLNVEAILDYYYSFSTDHSDLNGTSSSMKWDLFKEGGGGGHPFWQGLLRGKKDQQIRSLWNVLGMFLWLKIAQNEIQQLALFEIAASMHSPFCPNLADLSACVPPKWLVIEFHSRQF